MKEQNAEQLQWYTCHHSCPSKASIPATQSKDTTAAAPSDFSIFVAPYEKLTEQKQKYINELGAEARQFCHLWSLGGTQQQKMKKRGGLTTTVTNQAQYAINFQVGCIINYLVVFCFV